MQSSVLYWVPTDHSVYGLGGVLSRMPECSCGAQMSLLATVPDHARLGLHAHETEAATVAQIFYCMACEEPEGLCANDSPCFIRYISTRKLKSIQDMLRSATPVGLSFPEGGDSVQELSQDAPVFFEDVTERVSSSEMAFIPYMAVMGTMCPDAKRYLNEFPVGQGVYSGGVSPTPVPACPECSAEEKDHPSVLSTPMRVMFHMDSMAHEDIQFGCMDSFVIWSCPRHDIAMFKVYGDIIIPSA